MLLPFLFGRKIIGREGRKVRRLLLNHKRGDIYIYIYIIILTNYVYLFLKEEDQRLEVAICVD